MELVLVERIGQNVIVVNGAKAATFRVSPSKDELKEVARLDTLYAHALTATELLSEPELTVLGLQHRIERLENLNSDHFTDRCDVRSAA